MPIDRSDRAGRSGIGALPVVAHAHPFGGFFGKVESVRGRGVVTAMIELFGRLTPVEFQPDEIERVR